MTGRRKDGPPAAACGASRRSTSLVTLLLVAVSMSACVDTSQLAFRTDERLAFLAPEDRALVTLPLTVKWAMEGFAAVNPNSREPRSAEGYFALFVDRAPMRPRQTVRSIIDDEYCETDPSCPDADYLGRMGVYTTTESQLTVPFVSSIPDNRDETQLHNLTIVLLDTTGRRIGEYAYHLQFRLRREDLNDAV